MADKTFIIHSDWLQNIAQMPLEQQDKIIAEIVRYGTEMEMQYEDDAIVQMAVNFVKGAIDYSKDKYAERVDAAKKGGRKKILDEEKIAEMARDGKSSSQIAEILGCFKSAIDHFSAWKIRNKNEEKFEF